MIEVLQTCSFYQCILSSFFSTVINSNFPYSFLNDLNLNLTIIESWKIMESLLIIYLGTVFIYKWKRCFPHPFMFANLILYLNKPKFTNDLIRNCLTNKFLIFSFNAYKYMLFVYFRWQRRRDLPQLNAYMLMRRRGLSWPITLQYYSATKILTL